MSILYNLSFFWHHISNSCPESVITNCTLTFNPTIMKKLFFALTASTFLFAAGAMAQDMTTDPATEQPAMEDPAVLEESTTQDPGMANEDPAMQQPTDEATASAEAQEIQFDELPEAVKAAFEGSDYAMWQVQTVYEMAPEQETEASLYEISVTDGTTEETVTFNGDGEQQ